MKFTLAVLLFNLLIILVHSGHSDKNESDLIKRIFGYLDSENDDNSSECSVSTEIKDPEDCSLSSSESDPSSSECSVSTEIKDPKDCSLSSSDSSSSECGEEIEIIIDLSDLLGCDSDSSESCEISDSSSSGDSDESCELPTTPSTKTTSTCSTTTTTTTTTTTPKPCDPYECMLSCDSNYDPVCSNFGNYDNRCKFNCARRCNWEIQEATCPCEMFQNNCTSCFDPVCGSDGQTYKNPCLLNWKAKCTKGLWVVSTGYCYQPCLWGRCFCTSEYEPICGCDGNTYNNFCEFLCAKNCDANLEFAYDGKCQRGVFSKRCRTCEPQPPQRKCRRRTRRKPDC